MSKIKVMHVITDMNFGGAGKYLVDICEFIDKEKYEITAIVPKGSVLNDYLKNIDGIKILNINGIDTKSFSMGGVRELYSLMKKNKPDVIHSHACLSARIAGRLIGVKKIIYTRHCLQPKSNGLKKYIKIILSRILGSKVIAISKAVKNDLIDEGEREEDIFLIYHGVKIPEKSYDMEKLREKYKVPMDKIIITLIGRLETVKGQEHLLNIVDILKEKTDKFQVLLAGDGSNRSALEDRIQKDKLPVKLLGHIKDIDEIYELSDITVNTSNSEALSYASLEAFSHKKPVVAFDIDGINEVIINNKDGFLVEFKNYEEFAQRLITLINNKELRLSFGKCGYNKVNAMFSTENMIKQIEEVYGGRI